MPHVTHIDEFAVLDEARALRAAYARDLVAHLMTRLRREPAGVARA